MSRCGDVPSANVLRHAGLEFAVLEGARLADHEPFAILPQLVAELRRVLQRLRVEWAAVQHLYGRDAEELEVLERLVPGEADVHLVPDAEAEEVRRQVLIVDRMLGPQVLAADPPAVGQVEAHVVDQELLDPRAILSTSAVDRPGVDVAVAVRARVLAVELDADHDVLTLELLAVLQGLVIVVDTRREWEVEGPAVLHVLHVLVQHPTGRQHFLDRFVEEQLALRAGAVIEDVVAPFGDGLLGVELVGHQDLRDAGGDARVFDAQHRLLAEQVVVLADRRAVVEVVSAIGPQATLDQVVRVELTFRCFLCGLTAEHAPELVAREYTFPKDVACEKFRFHDMSISVP